MSKSKDIEKEVLEYVTIEETYIPKRSRMKKGSTTLSVNADKYEFYLEQGYEPVKK